MRMWEIRENDDYRFGRRSHYDREHESADKSYEEGYDQGYTDGYSKAMKETFYPERRGMR